MNKDIVPIAILSIFVLLWMGYAGCHAPAVIFQIIIAITMVALATVVLYNLFKKED